MDSRPEVRCFMDCARRTHVRKSGVSWTVQDGLTSGSPVFHGLCKMKSRPEVRCFIDCGKVRCFMNCARRTHVRKSGVSWTVHDGLTSGSPVFHGLCKMDSRPEVRCFSADEAQLVNSSRNNERFARAPGNCASVVDDVRTFIYRPIARRVANC